MSKNATNSLIIIRASKKQGNNHKPGKNGLKEYLECRNHVWMNQDRYGLRTSNSAFGVTWLIFLANKQNRIFHMFMLVWIETSCTFSINMSWTTTELSYAHLDGWIWENSYLTEYHSKNKPSRDVKISILKVRNNENMLTFNLVQFATTILK